MYSSVNELFADEIAELKGSVASKDDVIADQSKQIEYLKGLLRLYNIPESDYNNISDPNK